MRVIDATIALLVVGTIAFTLLVIKLYLVIHVIYGH